MMRILSVTLFIALGLSTVGKKAWAEDLNPTPPAAVNPTRVSRNADPRYWQNFDKAAQTVGAKFISEKQADQLVAGMLKSNAPVENQVLGKLIRAAQSDQEFAYKLQEVLGRVRGTDRQDYAYPFQVDGEFAQRSIYELTSLYKNSKTNQTLKSLLKRDMGVELDAATSARLDGPVAKAMEALNAVKQFNEAGRNAGVPCEAGTIPSNTQPPAQPPKPATYFAGSPQQMLADAMSEPLTFVGKGRTFKRSIPDCVLKNSKVYVISKGCGGAQNGKGSTGIIVMSVDGGMTMFDASSKSKPGEPISQLKREQYDGNWMITYAKTDKVKGDLDMNQFYRTTYYMAPKSSCITQGAGSGKNPKSTMCAGAQNLNPQWLSASIDFWKNPPEDFSKFVADVQRQTQGK